MQGGLRIVFSVPRYHPNHEGMVFGLRQAGHSVAFLVRHRHPTEPRHADVPVILLRRRRDALGALRRLRPDVVVARNSNGFHQALYVACRLLGIRFLLYVQSPEGFETLKPWRRLSLRLGLWPRHTVNSACPAPPRAVPGKTFDFLPFAVAPGPERPPGPGRAPLRVLTIGKLDQPRKNLPEVVRHLAPLLREGRLRLTIAGLRGPEPGSAYAALLAAIAEEAVGAAVTLRENLDHAASLRLYPEHDLFLLASSRERAAISPLEAMAAGLPVVCGSDNGTNYAIVPEETGLLFPDGDFGAMAAAVTRFVDRPAEVERMGRAARIRMAAEYAPDRYAQRFRDLIALRFGLT